MQWPAEERTEIIPGLYQGGHVWSAGSSLVLTDMREVRDFDCVLSLYADDDPQTLPAPGVPHIVWEIMDDREGGVAHDDEAPLRQHVDEVVDRLRTGQRVLVRCQLGWNRSGLVVALVLLRFGFSADEAIALIRRKRSPDALSNPTFERFVREHESEYRDSAYELPGGNSRLS